MLDEIDRPGRAGASARAQSERIRRRREALGRENRLLIGLLRTLTGSHGPQQRLLREERMWETGAEGEELLAESISRRCPDVPVLHDRRIPGSRANIDHLAFAPTGVYVIDTKRYHGRITVQASRFGEVKLRIAGRDRTRLILGMHRQLAVVSSALESLGQDIPVHGCLCFVAPKGGHAHVRLPLMRTLRVDGIPLYEPRRLTKRLRRPGPISGERARALQAELSLRLPPAHPH
jgi:hypothetical protein